MNAFCFFEDVSFSCFGGEQGGVEREKPAEPGGPTESGPALAGFALRAQHEAERVASVGQESHAGKGKQHARTMIAT